MRTRVHVTVNGVKVECKTFGCLPAAQVYAEECKWRYQTGNLYGRVVMLPGVHSFEIYVEEAFE